LKTIEDEENKKKKKPGEYERPWREFMPEILKDSLKLP
jgi:hypothetical protein